MRDKNLLSFVCFDCRSDVYYSVRSVPHTLLCDECLWIHILMPNPTERAEMRAEAALTRAAHVALAALR
jgi:hypothetical protein